MEVSILILIYKNVPAYKDLNGMEKIVFNVRTEEHGMSQA